MWKCMLFKVWFGPLWQCGCETLSNYPMLYLTNFVWAIICQQHVQLMLDHCSLSGLLLGPTLKWCSLTHLVHYLNDIVTLCDLHLLTYPNLCHALAKQVSEDLNSLLLWLRWKILWAPPWAKWALNVIWTQLGFYCFPASSVSGPFPSRTQIKHFFKQSFQTAS